MLITSWQRVHVSFYFFFLSKRATSSQILSFALISFVSSEEDKELDSNKLQSFAKNILLFCKKVGKGAKAPPPHLRPPSDAVPIFW